MKSIAVIINVCFTIARILSQISFIIICVPKQHVCNQKFNDTYFFKLSKKQFDYTYIFYQVKSKIKSNRKSIRSENYQAKTKKEKYQAKSERKNHLKKNHKIIK